MLGNPVLFEIGSAPWTLVGVCLLASAVLLVVGGGMLALLLVRYGKSRRLSSSEASRVALDVTRSGDVPLNHGPAVGAEIRVSFTIGDLRRARQAGDRLVFWGVPLTLTLWSSAFGLANFACMLWTREYVFAAVYVVLVPMLLIAWFMPWAAVHTKLE